MVLKSKTLLLFLAIIMVFGISAKIFAQEGVPAISLKDARLDDVVRMLAEKAGINLVLTKEIDKKISLQLKDSLPPLKLLEIIVNAHGYNLVKKDNIYTLEEKVKEAAPSAPTKSLDEELGMKKDEKEPKNYFQLTRTPVEQAEAKIRSLLSPQGRLEVNRQTNSVFVMDSPENVKKVEDFVNYLNLDPAAAIQARMQQKIFRINRMEPQATAQNIQSMLTPEKGKVVLDMASKTLIVTDSEEVLAKIEEFLKVSDQPEPQVYIRCHVIEVNVDAVTEAGFSFTDNDGWNFDDVHGTSSYSMIPANSKGVMGMSFINQSDNSTNPDHSWNFSSTANRNNFRLLSSPNLLCSNKQASKIQVTKETPYAQATTTTESGGTGTTTVTVAFKETGIMLEVTPDIYNDGIVKLRLKAEVSEITGTPQVGESPVPVVKKKLVESNVISKDRETIVIGGILEDAIRKNRLKVPLLGDLPILGFLFSREQQDMVKTELLIFMNISIVGEQYLKNMAKQEWKAQQDKFEKYDTEFEFYPHLKQKLEMDKLNPDYEKK